MKNFYIGIDLSSKKSGICILKNKKVCYELVENKDIIGILNEYRKRGRIFVGIDGPQGLSGSEGKRMADLIINAPFKCGKEIPEDSMPYSEFVKASLSLFYSLWENGYKIFNSSNIKVFEVIETFPYWLWKLGIKGELHKKTSEKGIKKRLKFLKDMGIKMDTKNHHIIDAGGCALITFLASKGNYIAVGRDFFVDRKRKVLREGWVILPFLLR